MSSHFKKNMKKNIVLQDFQIQYKDAEGGGSVAQIEGYASTFGNMDHDRDIVMAGAFNGSLATRGMPAMLYQHKTDKIPGIWKSAQEDSKGLVVKGQTLNTTLGKDTAEELRSGALKTMSIGYSVKEYSYDKLNLVRYIKGVELYEVSLVTFPANEQAVVTNVKAALEDIDTAADLVGQSIALMNSIASGIMQPTPELLGSLMQTLIAAQGLLEDPEEDNEEAGKALFETERQLEKLLRDAGVSRQAAKSIVTGGFKAITPQRDAGGDIASIINLLNKF